MNRILNYVKKLRIIFFQDGGCSAPLAAHARIFEKSLHIEGGVWSLDGKTFIKEKLEVILKNADIEEKSDVVSAILGQMIGVKSNVVSLYN